MKLPKFDILVSILGVAVSLVIIVFGLLGHTLYIVLGCLLLLVFVSWLLFSNRLQIAPSQYINRRGFFLFSIGYFVLFALSIMIIRFRPDDYQLPLSYFFLIAIMAGVLFLEIMTTPQKYRFLIIAQILLLGTNYLVSEMSLFPTVLGVDPWWHQYFTNLIVSGNSIPPGYIYSNMPIFLLLNAQLMIVLGLDYRTVSIIVGTLLIALSALIVYLIGSRLTKNWRIGLLSALVVIMAESNLKMGYWLIPTSLAGVFMIMVIFLLVNQQLRKTIFGTFILILLMFSVILTQSVTAACLAVILGVAYVGLRILKHYSGEIEQRSIPFSIPVLFTCIMFGWWMYASANYINSLGEFLRFGFNLDSLLGTNIPITGASSIPILEFIMNNLGVFLFFSIGIIGLLYLLSSKATTWMKLFALIAATPAIIAFLSLVFGLFILQDRWWYFAELTMAIPLGLSLYLLVGEHKLKLRSVAVSSIVLGIVFLMIISPSANIDNNTFSKNSNVRLALTDSELEAMTAAHQHFAGSLASDVYYAQVVMPQVGVPSKVIDSGLLTQDFSAFKGDMVLIRNEMIVAPFYIDNTTSRIHYDPGMALEQQGFDLVMVNNGVRSYIYY